jgi:hypothetical protein
VPESKYKGIIELKRVNYFVVHKKIYNFATQSNDSGLSILLNAYKKDAD